eukprot:TRINITY_DN195_c0_g1_i9.p1 TRINITY_DN195_c0_g1~~TRINITY_DN195_c0_g1_i9.p1  ORF type:complete len:153 (+),score=28.31 TRINITY_DN195_c0_g1_i9:1184-1642(+)
MDSTSLVDSLLTALGGNKPKDLYLSDSSEEAVKIFIAGFRRYEVSVDSPVTLQSCVEPSLFAVLELSVDGFSSSSSNEKNLKALQTFIGAPDDLSVFRKLIPLSLQEQDLTATTLKTKFIFPLNVPQRPISSTLNFPQCLIRFSLICFCCQC